MSSTQDDFTKRKLWGQVDFFFPTQGSLLTIEPDTVGDSPVPPIRCECL